MPKIGGPRKGKVGSGFSPGTGPHVAYRSRPAVYMKSVKGFTR